MPRSHAEPGRTGPATAAPRTRRPDLDPRGPRFGAGITAVLLLVVVFLSLTGASAAALSLLVALAALFAWGAFAGAGRHPWGLLFRRFLRPRLAPPRELENPAPPTFAQGVGLLVSVVGVLLGLVGLAPAVGIAAAAAFVAAFLNAAFDYCLGCQLYVVLVRSGLLGRGPVSAG